MSDPVNPYMQQGPADQGPYGQAPQQGYGQAAYGQPGYCLLYTSPSPRD